MTRVLIDGRLLERGASGVRDVLAGLVPALREISRAEGSQVIVAGRELGAEVRIPARGFTHFGLPATAARLRCDVILVPRQTRPPLSPVRCVPIIHDVGFERVPEFYPRDRRVIYANRIALRSRRALAVSAFTAGEVGALGTQCSLAVLPLAAMHGIEWVPIMDDRYVLCTAVQEPHKNLRRLVEAWALADTAGCRLVICGRHGRSTSELQAAIDRLGLRSIVSVVSGLTDADYAALLAGCWAYVQPSLYEGLCIPALDMAAAGVPTAVSSFANLGRVFGGSDPAQTFDPLSVPQMAAAIERVIHDRDARLRTSEWNRAHIDLTDWSRVANVAWNALQ